MEKNVNVLGILWIVKGSIDLFLALMLFGILFGISFLPDIGYEAPIILRSVGIGLGLFISILAAPQIIAGVGLMKMHEWARILTLIVAFFSLLNFPLGTALGVYSIVVLLKEETVQLFKK